MSVEMYAPGEEAIRLSIPALKQIIGETATMRDNWDESDDGKELKKLTKKGCSIQMPLGSDRYCFCCTRRHVKCG